MDGVLSAEPTGMVADGTTIGVTFMAATTGINAIPVAAAGITTTAKAVD
jgi:hypothetical protein